MLILARVKVWTHSSVLINCDQAWFRFLHFFIKKTLRFVRLRPRHIYDFIFEPIKIKSKILSSFRFFLSAFVRCTNKISYSMPRCRSFHHLKQMLFLFLSHYFVVVTEILLLSRVVNRSFRSFYFSTTSVAIILCINHKFSKQCMKIAASTRTLNCRHLLN